MNKTRRLRRRILSPNYYKNRLQQYIEQEKYWNEFKKFHCEEFFVGIESAITNMIIYKKEMPRVMAKIRWYRKKVWSTQSGK